MEEGSMDERMGTYRALEADEAGEDAEACGRLAALGRAVGAAFRPLLPAAVVAHDASGAAAATSRAVVGAKPATARVNLAVRPDGPIAGRGVTRQNSR